MRASARFGEPILLLHQDRGKWDHLLIRRGLAALERAEYERAASLAQNVRDRTLLVERAGARVPKIGCALASAY